MAEPDPAVAGYIARWAPPSVSPAAAAFARDVAAAAGPARAGRAKSLLHAAARLADWAAGLGLDLAAEVLLHPSVIERFAAHSPGSASSLRPGTPTWRWCRSAPTPKNGSSSGQPPNYCPLSARHNVCPRHLSR